MSSPSEQIGSAATAAVRRMSEVDIPAALAILEESPEAAMWSRESLVDSIRRGITWTAELDRSVAGILIGRVAGDEFEILNLAVAKRNRRRGAATKLVLAALEFARSAGAVQSYLEVRASNSAAIGLYSRLGFTPLGRRPNYYQHPTEDALLLVFHNEGIRP